MEYVQMTLDDYLQSKTEIKDSLGGIVRNFVRVGWQLTRISETEAYRMDGYKTLPEFARAEYGMTPDGVSRFMGVYEKYSVPGDTPELQERYKEFKFAQLTEMLQLPEEDREMIEPETKRENIRELKRFNKENEQNADPLLHWKEPQEEDKVEQAIIEFFRMQKDLLNELFSSEAYRDGEVRELIDMVNPSGNRSFKKGTVFLMMYGEEKGILIKEFGKGTRIVTWDDFFGIVQQIFGEAAAGRKTWENYFEKKEETHETDRMETEETAENCEEQPGAVAKESSEAGGHNLAAGGDDQGADGKTEDRGGSDPGDNMGDKDTGEKREHGNGPDGAAEYNQQEPEERPESKEEEPEQKPEKPEVAPAQQLPEEERKKRFGSRKKYLDSLNTYQAALYLAVEMEDKEVPDWMKETDFWNAWLLEEIDEEGELWNE